ncbi:MAG: Fic family protein [Akkermansiaceae bacterium]|nr:Fic family protein [Akkermansiaceae bacterium]
MEFRAFKFHVRHKLGIKAFKNPISRHPVEVIARKTGCYVTVSTRDEPFQVFVPDALPPQPPIVMDATLERLHGEAQLALGRLDGIVSLLPAPEQFLYAYVRKEAVASSQIEGTQSSLSDLLAYEVTAAPGIPVEDVREVSDCVAAYEHANQRMTEGFPLSLRLICEAHEKLLASGRGKDSSPGQFRRSQNWIGGSRPGNARFVPPPAEEVLNCMGALEKFLHDDPVKTPPLIKAALAHVQFETIHPFLDGNGRVGRLLIPLILRQERVLQYPLLHLSLFFKEHRARYYELLQEVRLNGHWEAWLDFFFQGVRDIAARTASDIQQALALFEKDRIRISQMGRSARSCLRIHEKMRAQPMTSIAALSSATKLTPTTIATSLAKLAEMGMVKEITGGKYGRLYAYDGYLKILAASE